MKQLSIGESFLDDEKSLSLFDVVFPRFKMTDHGLRSERLGSCFAIGIGVYATAAHNFPPILEARNRYKPLDPRGGVPTLQQMVERQDDMNSRKMFEVLDIKCGAMILDQEAIREGKQLAAIFNYLSTCYSERKLYRWVPLYL